MKKGGGPYLRGKKYKRKTQKKEKMKPKSIALQ